MEVYPLIISWYLSGIVGVFFFLFPTFYYIFICFALFVGFFGSKSVREAEAMFSVWCYLRMCKYKNTPGKNISLWLFLLFYFFSLGRKYRTNRTCSAGFIAGEFSYGLQLTSGSMQYSSFFPLRMNSSLS